jgi:leader peptidase (prepilin peptidase)/N-methyltransferase
MSNYNMFSSLVIGLIIIGFLAGGAAAGLLGRHVIGRLRRGAVFRPPCCEVAVGVCWALVGWRWATGGLPSWWLPVPLLLAWFGVSLTAVDLARRRLPDALTLAAYPVLGGGLAWAAAMAPSARLFLGALIGAMVFGGAHAVVHVLAPRSLGRGDVKLSGSLGAVLGALGWPALVLATVLASVITVGLAVAVRGVRGVPHGPGLLTATWLMAAFPGTSLTSGGLLPG